MNKKESRRSETPEAPEPKKFKMTPEHWGALDAFDWEKTARAHWSKMTTDERYVIYCAAEAEMEASRLYNLVVKVLEKRRGKR